MLGHLETLLEGIVADPQQQVSRLPLLTPREREQLLVEWNDTAVEYPRDRCIHELFEEQVARTPMPWPCPLPDCISLITNSTLRADLFAHSLRADTEWDPTCW